MDAEKHAGGVDRLSENRVDGIAEYGLEAECDPAGSAAHTTGKIDEEGMLLVDPHLKGLELPG